LGENGAKMKLERRTRCGVRRNLAVGLRKVKRRVNDVAKSSLDSSMTRRIYQGDKK